MVQLLFFQNRYVVPLFILVLAGACASPQSVVTGDATEDADPQHAIATQVPDTEIFLFNLDVSIPELVTGVVGNITNRDGYDNQPRFIRGSNDVLFAGIVDGRQSDVYIYRDSTGQIEQRTFTSVSEYSPTPLTGDRFAAVVVEEDGTQRLWRYAQDGAPLSPVRADVTGVGYFAFLDAARVGLFIVAEPVRLDIAERNDNEVSTVAYNIGRSLHMMPGGAALSFVQQHDDQPGVLSSWQLSTGEIMALVPMPDGVEDMVWLNDGRALAIDGGLLVVWRPGQDGWNTVYNLKNYLPGVSTRLAVNERQTLLAIVNEVQRQ
ncbi:MAG: hypothetical protein HKN70_03000 [Gammaproteobacteria bacterium]|nr:hypothetical protein [Gammaproteobacteria bacterium]